MASFFEANTHFAEKRYKDALKCIDKTLELNPQMPNALTLKYYILQALGKHSEAMDYIDKALETASKKDALWMDKAMS